MKCTGLARALPLEDLVHLERKENKALNFFKVCVEKTTSTIGAKRAKSQSIAKPTYKQHTVYDDRLT